MKLLSKLEVPGTKPNWILSGVGIIVSSDLLETPAPNSNCNDVLDKSLETNLRGTLLSFSK